MIHRCGRCGNASKIEANFKIDPVDAIGFVFLFIVALVPIYIVSFIVAMIDVGLEGDSWFQEIAFFFVTLSYFYIFGSKVARLIGLLVDYKFSLKSYCKKCNEIFLYRELPQDNHGR